MKYTFYKYFFTLIFVTFFIGQAFSQEIASDSLTISKTSNEKLDTSSRQTVVAVLATPLNDTSKIVHVNSHYYRNEKELTLTELKQIILQKNLPESVKKLRDARVMNIIRLPFSIVGTSVSFLGCIAIFVGIATNQSTANGSSNSYPALTMSGIVIASSGLSHLFVSEIFNGVKRKRIREAVKLYNMGQ